ncbi:hydroxymethylglutaryl-coenzyme A reductase family protein [Penicillium samsonianum]|uniref:hydroxymethylglutaryl-coenzyme A reductase family protein n=1 Tax=Penicillium samsonianum TaxID=1882272 RepID=UPI002548416E|nr:hydroxymethylglutaryl-coenzyme A reductase family protein [Penicillium samsonianum]KAJ6127958.1 hydroxymethylglutaryl-coenzyme A reductase family protein [Penicillium samsonianum]
MDSQSGIISTLKYIVADENAIKNAKIENCIGSVKIPVGLAGPLRIRGTDGTDGVFHAPLATCEATLVASCSRGSKLFTSSGGVQFKLLRDTMTRAPVFWFSCVEDAASFYDMIPQLFSEFRDVAQSTSKYARLVKISPQLVGSTVHVIFEYFCGDAAGQNMVTFATQKVCDQFAASSAAKEKRLQKVSIEGQLASEKSLSWGNILHSRGVSVIAWGNITKQACQSSLGCSTWDLYQLILNSKEAATRNGQLGYSINQANIVAAMFIACGQDAASVAESAWSQLTVEFDRETEEICVSSYFSSLPVGTVGGGTIYETQREALEILGCTGPGSKGRLAGIIASFALALDISTVAAVTNNTFAASHYKFGRSAGGVEHKL